MTVPLNRESVVVGLKTARNGELEAFFLFQPPGDAVPMKTVTVNPATYQALRARLTETIAEYARDVLL